MALPASAETKPGIAGLVPRTIEVSARRVDSFERGNASRQQFGRLEFRGGLVLTSPSTNFGGWSGLEIDADGRKFLAVSDAGAWMTGELVHEGTRLRGVKAVHLGPLLAASGKPLAGEKDRDAEGVRLLEGTLGKGTVVVSFEQNTRIGRLEINEKGLQHPAGYIKRSPDWARIPRNKSLEAIAVVRGGAMKGAIVSIAERMLDGAGNHTGWIWPGGFSGEPQRMSLRRIGDYDVTDAASMPDGSMIVLERSFGWLTGVKMRMRHIRAADIRPGALADGEILIEADMGYEIDNMEGLAIHIDPRGEPILTLISDDNFNGFLQRTLILQFAIPGARLTSAAGSPR